MADEILRADLLVNGFGAAGTVSYLVHQAGNRTRSDLENRALFLLATLGAMLVVREFSWIAARHVGLLDTLELIPATLQPLAMTMFAEGLLRRHLPIAMKVFVFGLTLFFVPVNLVGQLATHPVLGVAFPIALFIVMLLLAGFVIFRDHASLSVAENRLCAGVITIGLLGTPLALTDFRTVFNFPTVRMGALAVLALCQMLARGGEALVDDRGVILYLLRVASMAGLATVAILTLSGEWTAKQLAMILPVALALVLTFDLWERIRTQHRRSARRGFLRWLATDDSPDLASFLEAMSRCPALDDYLVVGEKEIESYDRDAILSRLRLIGHDCTLWRLRREAGRDRGRTQDAAEQIVDLLERYQMTQAVLLSESPPRLLLVNRPELTDPDSLLELRLIARRARALSRFGAARA